jgi:hypothetical protein
MSVMANKSGLNAVPHFLHYYVKLVIAIKSSTNLKIIERSY